MVPSDVRFAAAAARGCAVLTRDGSVVEGVNVENAAYPLGVCAERTTFSRAIAEGFRPGDFTVAATTASPSPTEVSVTPMVSRPVARISPTEVRITSPLDLIAKTS